MTVSRFQAAVTMERQYCLIRMMLALTDGIYVVKAANLTGA